MAEILTDDALTVEGVAALEERLGPAEALRFMALLSREPFDYQEWREEHFQGVDLDTLLDQAASTRRDRPR